MAMIEIKTPPQNVQRISVQIGKEHIERMTSGEWTLEQARTIALEMVEALT